MEIKLTFDLLPVVGVVLVLLGYYFPGFQGWFNALESDKKQGAMLILMFLVAAVVCALSIFGLLTVYSPDPLTAIKAAVVDFVIALCANAGVYFSTRKINDKFSARLFGRS